MILFLLGLITGAIGGMGIGGGSVLIPSLVLFTKLNQQAIQGINLISFIPIAVVALIIHYKNKNLLFKIILPLILSGIIGAFIGSSLSLNISSELLRKLFGLFLLFMGFYELFYKNKKT